MTRVPDAVATLEVDPRSVRAARQHVRTALTSAGLHDLLDSATLAVSEVVTNAIVHAGTEVRLRVFTDDAAARVEVEDRGLQLPVRRDYSDAAGTGRGLAMVEDVVSRWGVLELADGKVVWFEVGASGQGPEDGTDVLPVRSGERVRIELRRVPLLMHWAWQEHAAALLREYLLHALGDDESDVLTQHAHASEALSLLHAQLPVPAMSSDPQALLADVTGAQVTADSVSLDLPVSAVPHFGTLDRLLDRSIEEASAGHFLVPPTAPEVREMRRWICAEVARQASGAVGAVPFEARTDAMTRVEDVAVLTESYGELGETEDAVLAADDCSVVVAVSTAALRLLGYSSSDDVVGRRLVALMPARFRQAHIAGATMYVTNGRDRLIGVPVRVPMLRADGSEVEVDLVVQSVAYDDGRRAFVGRFEPVEQA